jgi:uncharacterized protein YgiM (DUF1202 family)
MSENYPPDEPIIGADPSPFPSEPIPNPQGNSRAVGSAIGDEPIWEEEEGYDGDGYDDDGDYAYDDGYYGEPPARQPMFYVFIALAGVVLVVLAFLVFSFVHSGGSSPKQATTGFNVQIDQPLPNQTIVVGTDQSVSVQAKATEAITRIQLYVNDRLVDETDPTDAPADGIYRASFKLNLPSKGDYTIYVRVTAASTATKDSTKVTIHAVEQIGDRPVSVAGKVITPTIARVAPSDNADSVRQLNAGETVNILGKTADVTWLLVDIGGPEPRWVKRDAIQEQDSLALVPVRAPTPTPGPSPSATPSPAGSPSATTIPNAPDFAPTNAVLTPDGTRLRVTIGNFASNGYAGALVVSVTGVPVSPAKQAFNVSLPANGSTTVDFVLSSPITAQASGKVQIDPDQAIPETNRDNNTATFVLQPAVEPPNLTITAAVVSGSQVNITITNVGGELKSTTVTVRVTFGAATLDQPQTMALAKGQSITVSVPKPSAVSATAQLFIGGQAASSPFPFNIN